MRVSRVRTARHHLPPPTRVVDPPPQGEEVKKRSLHHEALLVDPDGGADHLGRQRQEFSIERSHQRHRPFDEARDLVEQGLVLDQLKPLRERQMLGVRQDDFLAPHRIEHDLGFFEPGDIVLEMPRLERLRRHETMAARGVAGRDTIDCERHDVGVLGLGPERRDDGMQRPHPGERARACRALAPAHRLRPRKGADHERQDFGQHVDRGAARLLDQRHVEVALLGVLLDRRFCDRGEPRALEEALHGVVGGADAGALLLFPQVGLARRDALHREREPPRRHEGGRAFIDEAGIDQAVRHHLAQILRRPRLHAGGDFLGEQLEQEIGHQRTDPFCSPPPCGEGSGVGVGVWATCATQPRDPPLRPSPTRGEGEAASCNVAAPISLESDACSSFTVAWIASRTPSTFPSTSLFQKRRTR